MSVGDAVWHATRAKHYGRGVVQLVGENARGEPTVMVCWDMHHRAKPRTRWHPARVLRPTGGAGP